jgi:hypothetical protein
LATNGFPEEALDAGDSRRPPFDGERFWPDPATVLTNGPTVLGIEQ